MKKLPKLTKKNRTLKDLDKDSLTAALWAPQLNAQADAHGDIERTAQADADKPAKQEK